MRWIMVCLVLSMPMSGCLLAPDGGGAPPPSATPEPARAAEPANGTFHFVDVEGSLQEVPVRLPPYSCDTLPPNAAVDLQNRSITAPEAVLRQWRGNATVVVRNTVLDNLPCHVPTLVAQEDVWFWGRTACITLRLTPRDGALLLDGWQALEEGARCTATSNGRRWTRSTPT